jgi:asparagine synthase (glutamine-hydrolysing)
MCGIVGIFRQRPEAEPVDAARLALMRDSMAHRGPDGAGAWIDPRGLVGLGHRRLSIIDLDPRASQPMLAADGRLAITYNGEIYNYREVRRELEALGVSDWRTTSDTEVILHAFRQWGIECLQRLRGMFAFGLWDGAARQLWLVRDRIGIKPLYYAVRDGRLCFASEIKALLVDPHQPRAMDETSLFHFLSLMTSPAPRTMFRGIDKIPGGCWLRADAGGGIEVRRYWDALEEAANRRESLPAREGEILELVRAELATAVAYRGVADVPVGVFLSGGIDSSTNAALFARSEGKPIKTFSIGYEGEHASYRNELHYARLMADEIGSDHHERLLDVEELIALLPRIVHLQDEPIADPVCFPVYCVSELARQNGIAVAQVGEGADELFAGYPAWHRILRLHRATDRLGKGGAALAKLGLKVIGKGEGHLAETLRRRESGEPFFWSGAEIFAGERKQRLLSARMREAFAGRSSSEAVAEISDRFAARAREPSTLNWMTYVDLNLRLPELLLMRVDKMSMGVSLECREPFLDHKLVGLALAIPTAIKLAGSTPKAVLKRAVRGLVPDVLIDRRKQGFGVPIREWFLDRLGPVIEDEVGAFVGATDVVDRAEVARLFSEKDGVSLWFLYNLAAWHRHFIREWRPGISDAPIVQPAA